MLEDDLYEPVLVQSHSRSMTKKENVSEDETAGAGVKLAVVSFQGLGEKYERSYYEEKTYGEVLAYIERHSYLCIYDCRCERGLAGEERGCRRVAGTPGMGGWRTGGGGADLRSTPGSSHCECDGVCNKCISRPRTARPLSGGRGESSEVWRGRSPGLEEGGGGDRWRGRSGYCTEDDDDGCSALCAGPLVQAPPLPPGQVECPPAGQILGWTQCGPGAGGPGGGGVLAWVT